MNHSGRYACWERFRFASWSNVTVNGQMWIGKYLIPELQEYVHATQQKSEPSNGGSRGGRMDIYEEY